MEYDKVVKEAKFYAELADKEYKDFMSKWFTEDVTKKEEK